jgi:hypothetical protein
MEGTIYGNQLPRGTDVKKWLGTTGAVYFTCVSISSRVGRSVGRVRNMLKASKNGNINLENVYLVGLYCAMNCTT